MKGKELIIELAKLFDSDWTPCNQGNSSIWLEKKLDDKILSINFTTTRTYEGFKFVGVMSGSVRFLEVEDILSDLYKQHDLGYELKTIHTSSKRQDYISDYEIVNVSDLDKIKDWITESYTNDIVSFFDSYNTLKKVNEQIDSLKKEDLSSFVFAPPVINIFTIKGLLRTKDFGTYSSWALDVYEQMSVGKEDKFEGKSLRVLKELKKLLTEE
ncbi:hypothetical protein EV201_0911 [Ancylomarina subtilis]|uniref:Uncharacterized protein n=1 Tax=Ancylomarina subtilis TaxID=1639035 RepID=A0A4V2FT04_9BACT|nr:hypothetical protein [Ancylomarina subtilis]RZT96275.1 hypothetical protein EV201_0911 [Ancylomarina subtilis]